MPRKLVIVESPAKARTIGGYLGPDFEVEASIGHVRDLPQPSELPADMKKGPYGKFAVDVEGDFEPYYVVDADKKKKVAELRRKMKDADELYLATDEDREGEAIAWHLHQVLNPKIPVYRMVFHEITNDAINRALESPREIDAPLVDAQETRRILDRLVGYEVSPLLWRKVRSGLSAGRVQSVATRLVVERERERMAFRAASYWSVQGTYTAPDAPESFDARLVELDGARVATGRDFGDDGVLTERARGVVVLDEASATAVATALRGATSAVEGVETKPYRRRPAAPFTTSTLQQEASRKLRLASREAMRVAQGLYENGFITYMRTDSTNLSSEAVGAARRRATELYGPASIPDKPRLYAGKAKGAQEAHEAIRPAGDQMRTPDELASQLDPAALRLYDLIWKRTVASQMIDATGSTATLRVAADLTGSEADAERAILTASGTVITERGFLAAYEEGRDDERHRDKDGETRLPDVSSGDVLDVLGAEASGHETTPPPRYTEASLVKALEERGIGRPSTYAATIGVITDRGYVTRRGQALVASWLAFSVVRLLEENLPRLVDYDFTAEMESDLDRIATGELDRTDWLAHFYRGGEGREGLRALVEGLGDIDARAVNSIDIGEGITVRVGRYGPYVEEAPAADAKPGEDGAAPVGRRASIPDDVAPDELSVARAKELLEAQADDGRELGEDPETGHTIIAKNGRFGPYVTEVLPEPERTASGRKKPGQPKPRTASLFKDMDLATVDIDDALRLLSLPRVIGQDPASGEDITAQNGRYGPYLKKGTDSRSLETEDQIFGLTLEQALEIYAQPKRRRGATARPPLKELGTDPVSEKPVIVKDGRFGPYVTDGTTNATLRKDDPIETLTNERAYELLAEKRAKGPAKKPARKAPAKKPAAKKPAARKPATGKK
ncbi:type I DNA topoisomerase [Georgenia sp. Z1491]|uniref:type I DNA topoisomerase n=1 Tax=Georgenia sp. Z1491 TaxID=3416707 RepID=UPI003CEDE261